jgi:hypothetical protein
LAELILSSLASGVLYNTCTPIQDLVLHVVVEFWTPPPSLWWLFSSLLQYLGSLDTNCITFRNVENFKNIIFKEQNFMKETKESFGMIFWDLLFCDMEFLT